jgi:tetratricopeptide (TPR) repeat protein
MLFVGCGGSQPDGSRFQHDQAAALFLEAMKVRPTDQARALELLTQSIEARPSHNAYFHRAWIHAQQGREAEAGADVAAGLELEPENRELKWLEAELNKPATQRKLDGPPPPAK